MESSQTFYCQLCSTNLSSFAQYEQHLASKNHKKKAESVELFKIPSCDLYEDSRSLFVSTLEGIKHPLIGLEHIIFDKVADVGKCLLCCCVLKNPNGAMDHVKTLKHQQNYLEKEDPEGLRKMSLRSRSKSDFNDSLFRRCNEVARSKNKAKVLTYVEGYGAQRASVSSIPLRKQLPLDQTEQWANVLTTTKTERRVEESGGLCGSEMEFHLLKELVNKASADEPDCIPTSFEVLKILLTASMIAFPEKEAAYVQSDINTLTDPVVGLEYVAEYVDFLKHYEPGYLCTLCEVRLSPRKIIGHIVSETHRLKYMENNYHNFYTIVTSEMLNQQKRTDLLSKFCGDIESRDGRGVITLKIQLPHSARETVFSLHRPVEDDKTTEFLRMLQSNMAKATEAPDAEFDRFDYPTSSKRMHRELFELPEPVAVKPKFVFSERAEREQKKAQIERIIPVDCYRNTDCTYYSTVVKQFEVYCRSLADPPTDKYFSLRAPISRRSFYGEWLPLVMRRVQDKFNFQLEHVKWLQKLLLEANVPLNRPVSLRDLRPLESEVEYAVLAELVDEILAPNWAYSKPQFEMQSYELVVPNSSDTFNSSLETKVYAEYEVLPIDDAINCEAVASPRRNTEPTVPTIDWDEYETAQEAEKTKAAEEMDVGDDNDLELAIRDQLLNKQRADNKAIEAMVSERNEAIAKRSAVITDSHRSSTEKTDLEKIEIAIGKINNNDAVDKVSPELKDNVRKDSPLLHDTNVAGGRTSGGPVKRQSAGAGSRSHSRSPKRSRERTRSPKRRRSHSREKSQVQERSREEPQPLPSPPSNFMSHFTSATGKGYAQATGNSLLTDTTKTAPPPDVDERQSGAKDPVPSVAQPAMERLPVTKTEPTEQQKKIYHLIDQILTQAESQPVQTPVMSMLMSFNSARELLFLLATKQPDTLKQLITVIKMPNLNVPPELVQRLRVKLEEFAEQNAGEVNERALNNGTVNQGVPEVTIVSVSESNRNLAPPPMPPSVSTKAPIESRNGPFNFNPNRVPIGLMAQNQSQMGNGPPIGLMGHNPNQMGNGPPIGLMGHQHQMANGPPIGLMGQNLNQMGNGPPLGFMGNYPPGIGPRQDVPIIDPYMGIMNNRMGGPPHMGGNQFGPPGYMPHEQPPPHWIRPNYW